jgi:predicted MFS family arabinose efflux permease
MSIQSASRLAISGSPVTLVATLVSIYIVSQFLRNSIGVIAPNLAHELGLLPAEIGLLSSTFFLTFAAAQIPLGMALDRFGPRICLVAGAVITVVGAIVFACAASSAVLIFGRALLGLGSAGAFVASLAVYARRFPPDRFATLAGLQVGIGTVGALIATAPLAFSTAAIGWRASFLGVAAFTSLIGLLIAVVVKDEAPSARSHHETLGESLSGILAVMRTPSVGRLFVMNLVAYSTFGLIVGLWGGPYLTHIYGYDLEQRGNVLLIAVLSQIVGSVLWGPLDRRDRKPQASGPRRRGYNGSGTRLSRAGRNAYAVHAGGLVCGLWLRDRIWPRAGRARQSVVLAPSGRTGADHSQHGHHGRHVLGPNRQRVRDRIVSGGARRRL